MARNRPVTFLVMHSLQRSSYSSTSLVRGFWNEIFWPSKPRTTEEPRTGEGAHLDKIEATPGYLVALSTELINQLWF